MAYSLALGTISFMLAVVWGAPLIRLLYKYHIGKQIRIEGPSSHQVKTGTPTMGGLMIIIPVLLITVALNIANLLSSTEAGYELLYRLGWPGDVWIGRSILVPLGVMVAYAALGAIDDLRGLSPKRDGQGLLARYKFLWQVFLALGTALALHFGLNLRSLALPTVAQKIDIGLWYVPIAMFIIVGTSNAVNLTDGLDGLAGSIAAVSFAAYGVIAYLQGQIYLVSFCFTVVGAIMAFLWYNAYPADLFMGDTGSLSLGATLGAVALMTGQWLLLPLVSLIFVAEAMSVLLQVAYFKLTKGKRLFKMSPLHHHFELLGWSETQVTQRFWLVAGLSAMLGIALALL
ncbi:MAG: phospho-N-acetylmuramoyl-pentapeptide-transferase [Anaerolineae bacterium]